MSGKEDKDLEDLIRPRLVKAAAYTPIHPVEVLSEHSGIPVTELVKLDANENPYGCSSKVKQALAQYPYYHIYPDPEQRKLRKALGEYAGVEEEHIVAGAGSDELIDLILRLFIEPDDEVINCPPTFGMYPFSTEICSGRIVNVPRDESFAVDAETIKKAITGRTKAIFIASPNNPSGNLALEEDIVKLVDTGIALIIDEAYHEFSGQTVAPLVPRCDNLMVLRSFSKWAGLAGLRIGYGIFPKKIVPYLMKIKQPYNINVAAEVAALESLADLDYLKSTVRALTAERERLFQELSNFDFLHPFPSYANFILCAVSHGNAPKLIKRIEERGIFLRYFDTPLLKDFIRISVGKPEHTDMLIESLETLGKDLPGRTAGE